VTAAIAPKGAERTYPGLDVLRGWAALTVVCYHSRNLLGIPFFASDHLAVDVFFLMSGWVIAHAYEHKMPRLGILGFLKVRVIRFYPLFVLGLAIGVLRFLILIRFSHQNVGILQVLEALAFNLFFLPAPPNVLATNDISPLDGPAWTLMLEMAINVAYALAFRWLTTRVLIGFVALALAGLVFTGIVCHGLAVGPHWPTAWGGVARVCFAFPLGVLLYRLDLPPIRLGFLVLPLLATIVCLGGSTWVDLAFVVFASPALVLIAAHSTPKWPALAAYVAGISYCIYAIHVPLIIMTDGLTHRLGVSPVGPTLAVIAGLLLVCPMLNRWYDEPLRRWLSRLGRPRRAVVATPG
jgi:peptidoglycan/LPS O-acetylase OafA/YrhL